MSSESREELTETWRSRRWLILPLPFLAGLLIAAVCFWAFRSAYAYEETYTAELPVAPALAPVLQTVNDANRYEVKTTSTSVRHSRSVAWGDVDGDGDLDLAVGNGIHTPNINNVDYNTKNQIYFNDGKGIFSEQNIDDMAADTRAVAWGDWNGDGDIDLAVANYGQVNQVYENISGELSIDPEKSIGWTSSDSSLSTSLAWGDVDGDGLLDLAIGNESSPNQVYRNISGTLELYWESPFKNEFQTTAVTWADWDQDGDLDLATANYNGPEQIFENISNTLQFDPQNGVGWQSETPEDLVVDYEPCGANQWWGDWIDGYYASSTQSMAWGDWDNDGDLDLATGGGNTGNDCGYFVRVYENISGTLQIGEDAGWQLADSHGKFKPASLAWGDWDGDGDQDLIAGNQASSAWGKENRVYENVGGALKLDPGNGFGWQSTINPGLNAETTYAVALGDADGDGDLDLAVGNGGLENGGQANLILQNKAPVVAIDPVPWESADANQGKSVAWGDWDGDGDLDLAVGNYGQPNQVYENVDGVLQFDPENNLGWQSSIIVDDQTTSVAWGDWDGDGDLDLAVGNENQPDYVYENEGETLTMTLDGGLGWVSPLISATQSVAWGDWDRDGDLDLAAGHCGNHIEKPVLQAAVVYENDRANDKTTLRLDPDLDFGWQSPQPICAWDVAWGDWDNDSDLDLAAGARVYENVRNRLRLNESAGWGWNGNIAASSVAWGDVDGDGDLDLAVGTWNRNRVYENVGGYLVYAPTSDLGWASFDIQRTREVAWGDVDGDEDLDLVVANASNWGFEPNQVFENVNGRLSTRAVWQSPDGRNQPGGTLQKSHAVALGDVDSDGDLDLAFANYCTENNCDDGRDRKDQLYINMAQGGSSQASSSPRISIEEPYKTSSADFYASPEVLASNVISLPYTLRDPQGVPVGRIEVFFSQDGGDKWQVAVPVTGTQTTSLETSASGKEHIFAWDTFASDFFGQSDNMAIRMIAYPTPPATVAVPEGTYRYFNGVSNSIQRPFVTATSFPFRVQSTQIKVVDEDGNPVEGALIFRLRKDQVSGAELMPEQLRPLVTDDKGLLSGGGELEQGDRLLALAPISVSTTISFTNKFSFYHTSGRPTNSGLNLYNFRKPGIIELKVSKDNPLLLFHPDFSLEWDARNDEAFLVELEDGIKRASELLYDVSNGQVALGNVRVFQGKGRWSDADAVVLANNSLRPSAAIGGISQIPISETVTIGVTGTKTISNAYVGGQIRMGTVWDPFGENNADLGPDWWQTLAHELSHYLLFLPDDYLGFKDGTALGKIECQGSFMTSSFDPEYSEFLTENNWTGECQDSLAERTTGRNDWETVQNFYPMLHEPTAVLTGPNILPLEVTTVYFIDPPQESSSTLRARNFVVRDDKNVRVRLPSAQAYLIQTQGTDDPSDDMLIHLGTPTGGGDRLKVRGAYPGDRLCLFDRSGSQKFAGCIDSLSYSDVSIRVNEVDNSWQPQIEVHPLTTHTLQITVTQQISDNQQLNVQVYPAHYWSEPGLKDLSPTKVMSATNGVHTQTLKLLLPAYDISVRVWVEGDHSRETIDQFRLNLPWDPASIGGAQSQGIGGAQSQGIGGAQSQGIGGAQSQGIGGAQSQGIGGAQSQGIGGAQSQGIGGAQSQGIGGAQSQGIGGAQSQGIGGAQSQGIGGAQSLAAQAPILSADAQVVIYNENGFFEDNGVETMQILGHVPQIDTHPWLVPVGQAYQVTLDPTVDDKRIISLSYLQRDVPEGYEHTLNIYFLPQGETEWQRLKTKRFVENLVVSDLQKVNGTYAVMSTIEMPQLNPGWNLFAYPLPDTRLVTDTLASISGANPLVFQGDITADAPENVTESNVTEFEFGNVYWIWVEGEEGVTPYLAPPKRSPDGIVPGS